MQPVESSRPRRAHTAGASTGAAGPTSDNRYSNQCVAVRNSGSLVSAPAPVGVSHGRLRGRSACLVYLVVRARGRLC
eukprot:6404193-Prymnesium_polylepis.1